MPTTRSPDFRFIFTNAVGLGISDNEFRFMFAFAEDLTSPADNTEQIGVIMSHKTAKFVMNVMKQAIESYEEASGQVIPFDADSIAAIKDGVVIKSASGATDAETPS